jgi:hypothetical protein
LTKKDGKGLSKDKSEAFPGSREKSDGPLFLIEKSGVPAGIAGCPELRLK